MADFVEGLRNLVLGKIDSISHILVGPSQMFDVQEALEKIDQIVDAVDCLDSVTRLPEDVYRDLSIATGKNNRFPFLDILGYLKNTHKKSQIWKSEGFLLVFFKYPKISKNGNPLFFPVSTTSARTPPVHTGTPGRPSRPHDSLLSCRYQIPGVHVGFIKVLPIDFENEVYELFISAMLFRERQTFYNTGNSYC